MEIVIQLIKSIRHQIIFRDIFNKLVVQLSKNYFWCNTNQTWVWLPFYQQSSTRFQFYNHNKSVNYLQLWLILTALFWLNSISYQWENYCLVAARNCTPVLFDKPARRVKTTGATKTNCELPTGQNKRANHSSH